MLQAAETFNHHPQRLEGDDDDDDEDEAATAAEDNVGKKKKRLSSAVSDNIKGRSQSLGASTC